jgi:hypothetical protein
MRASDVTRAVAKLQTARAAAALQPLAVERGRGPIDRPAQAAAAAPRRRPKAWNGPAIIEGLAQAIDHLQRGERLTQRALKRIAARQDGVPTYSVVQRHARHSDTTFEALIRQAERLSRVDELAPGDP